MGSKSDKYCKRLKDTLSISCDSNVILDFEDNYIHIVCSKTLKIGESEFNIGCFIGMERSCHHITICNLTLYGLHSYSIFIAQSHGILFQNFKITIKSKVKQML